MHITGFEIGENASRIKVTPKDVQLAGDLH